MISKGFQWQTISSSLYVQGLSSVASTGLVTLSPAVSIDWEETYFVQSVTATASIQHYSKFAQLLHLLF